MPDPQNKTVDRAPETMKGGFQQRKTNQTWRSQKKILHSTNVRSIFTDHIDRPDNINHSNSIALTIDPIVCGSHLTRAPMGINSSPNLLHQDSVHQIGIDRSRIKPTKNILSRCRSSCKGQVFQAHHPGGCLRITKQTPYRRVSLRHCPLIQ